MEFLLYKRKFKLVDDVLYSYYKHGRSQTEKWHLVKLSLNNKGYKKFGFKIDGVQKTLQFHRVVYFAHNPDWDFYDNSKDNQIDHWDGKDNPINHPKNNHISNLSVVNQQENNLNTRCKGYSFNKRLGKYHAYINLNYKRIHLGFYDTPEEAKQAYLNKKPSVHIRAR